VPKPLAGNEVCDWVKEIITIFGKNQKKESSEKNIWKKGQYSLIFHISPIYMYNIV